MASEALRYLSDNQVIALFNNIPNNLTRYLSGDFLDLSKNNGWQIESTLTKINLSKLQKLKHKTGSISEDIENSIIVHEAFEKMTPAIATEERIWVRFCHIECLEYTRNRWLAGKAPHRIQGAILKHMFAKGRPGVRDDNAISRLWWNMQIAKIIDPEHPEETLHLILQTSDYRMALFERSNTGARIPLSRAIVRALRQRSWISEHKKNFLRFMKELNRDGGGILFEAHSDYEADRIVDLCTKKAQNHFESLK